MNSNLTTAVQISSRNVELGSREVVGYNDYQGTGFVIDGTASYIGSGPEYDFMKDKFSFLTRVFEVTVNSAKQML